jgi:hypothetical protein
VVSLIVNVSAKDITKMDWNLFVENVWMNVWHAKMDTNAYYSNYVQNNVDPVILLKPIVQLV